jgi:hypothetical protein
MRGRRRLARNGGRTLSRAFGASSPASGRGERITLRANKQHRAFALPRLVIARSGSDQAIQLPAQAALDCFADARNDASLIPPRVAGRGGPPERAVGGASAGTPAPPPHAPSTTLRAVPLPRFAGADKEKHSRDALRARALLTTKKRKKTNKQKEGRRSAERRIVSPIAACAAARPLGEARPPSGAPPRHSPPAITPMAQPQTRVSAKTRRHGVLPARRKAVLR